MGKEQIYTTFGYGLNYDSNLFASAGGGGDFYQSLSTGLQYSRRAGLIAVDATASLSIARFDRLRAEDYADPTLTLAFAKKKGRLTGSFSLSVQRQSRSDTAANIRDVSWLYSGDLSLKFPVNNRYFITTDTAVAERDYQSTSVLFNLGTIAQTTGINYAYSSKLNLSGSYRIRFSGVPGSGDTYDHAILYGMTGKILPKLSGNISVGYQWRVDDAKPHQTFSGATADIGLTWPMNNWLVLGAQLNKDFSTTSTAISTDTTTLVLTAAVKTTKHVDFSFDAGDGYASYLGAAAGGRHDNSLFADASASSALTKWLTLTLSCGWSRTTSTLQISDFNRRTASLTLISRF